MSDDKPLTGEVVSTKTGGRLKGSKNKVHRTAKDNILAVFERIGGRQYMARWARQNPTEFFKLYARLIPVQVDAEVSHHFVMSIPQAATSTDAWASQHVPKLTAQ